ncbi:hypothetical protein MMC18_001359 [Xylographa bjoerkii]|nr:hypothetical protein [Xylographa bjoerkii]
MSASSWHKGIDQKVHGTWNLHNALQGKDSELDFFLMLSSVAGSIGTATESNYCAANSFLDAFARYRRSLGLPATSIGLGMISELGFLHENSEIEATLLRKGIHPFTEDEFLQIMDLSISSPPQLTSHNGQPEAEQPEVDIASVLGHQHYMESHILTGLELHGFLRIRSQGFHRTMQVLEDPRCAIITRDLANHTEKTSINGSDNGAGSTIGGVPGPVGAVLAETTSGEDPDLISAIRDVIAEKLATILLMPAKKLGADMQLANFGHGINAGGRAAVRLVSRIEGRYSFCCAP